jgi:hypothetical protein
MNVAAVLVYNRALTPTEQQQIQTYLTTKYVAPPSDTVSPVVSPNQQFGITQSATEGSVVGSVSASDNIAVTGFSIVGGDPNGVFAIDAAGTITVANPTTLNAQTTPSYALTVQAADAAGNTGSNIVTINVASIPVSQGVVLHLEADTGVQLNGSTVTGWNDTSGNNNHLTAAGNPTIGLTPSGASAVTFDGTGDLMSRVGGVTGLPTGNTNRTVFVVTKYNGNGYGGFAWGKAATNQTFGTIVNPTGQLMIQGWGTANDFSSGQPGTGQGWLIQSAVVQNNQLQHYRNGTLIDTRTKSYNTLADRIVLGAEIDNSPQVAMNVAAVLVYNRALTPTEQQQIQTYLTTKYLL